MKMPKNVDLSKSINREKVIEPSIANNEKNIECPPLTKSLRVLFLHRRPPSWTTLVLYSRAVFIFNEPTFRLAEFIPRNRFRGPIHVEKYQLWVRKSILSWFLAPIAANYKLQIELFWFHFISYLKHCICDMVCVKNWSYITKKCCVRSFCLREILAPTL